LQEAKFRLKEVGLELDIIDIEYSDEYHKGVVMSQSLPRGMEVNRNQKINLTVSDGPAPSSLEVPNLVGKSLESAQNALDLVGIKIGTVISAYRPNLVPGTVLKQSVNPGHKAMLTDSVNIIISTDQPIGNN
jgi:serine/threonine-protein kinase